MNIIVKSLLLSLSVLVAVPALGMFERTSEVVVSAFTACNPFGNNSGSGDFDDEPLTKLERASRAFNLGFISTAAIATIYAFRNKSVLARRLAILSAAGLGAKYLAMNGKKFLKQWKKNRKKTAKLSKIDIIQIDYITNLSFKGKLNSKNATMNYDSISIKRPVTVVKTETRGATNTIIQNITLKKGSTVAYDRTYSVN
jgi:hypothetical protein